MEYNNNCDYQPFHSEGDSSDNEPLSKKLKNSMKYVQINFLHMAIVFDSLFYFFLFFFFFSLLLFFFSEKNSEFKKNETNQCNKRNKKQFKRNE